MVILNYRLILSKCVFRFNCDLDLIIIYVYKYNYYCVNFDVIVIIILKNLEVWKMRNFLFVKLE